MNEEDISLTVRNCVAESLAIPVEGVTPGSRLIDDLGADSLDFLDMIFSLEKEFGVRLRDPKLDLLVRADFSQAQITQNGHLSTGSIRELGEWLPELKDAKNITLRDVYAYITVQTLVRLVQEKLAEL